MGAQVQLPPGSHSNCYTVRRETLAPGKFGQFGEWLRIRQITIRQIFPLVKYCGSWEFSTSRSQISQTKWLGIHDILAP